MRSHADEVSLAQAYTRSMPFEGLGKAQRAFIRERGQELYRCDTVGDERFMQGLASSSQAVSADMWLVQGAPHTKAFATAREDYCNKMMRCFAAMTE